MFTLKSAEVSESSRKIFDRLISPDSGPNFVLGRNKYAQSVAEVLKVDGFIDDYTEEREYLGKPLLRMSELPKNCIVISCVVDASPLVARKRLGNAGINAVIDYFALQRLLPGQIRSVDYSEYNKEDLINNRSKYEWIYGRLADKTSQQVLQKVSQFRYSWNLDCMEGFQLAVDRQYFDDFVPLVPQPVFVDGGGFDGQTTRRFAQRYPDYRRIYYFEPCQKMEKISREKLSDLNSVMIIPKGLSCQNGWVQFDASSGPASKISEQGNEKIEVVRLDDEVTEPVTFIKLDIEGAEFDAIAGAQKHIASDSPILAVCVYHDQRDFWRIPERVLQYNPAYKVYLRHYTEGILETVMYFIPSSST